MDKFAEQLARPIRNRLTEDGYRAIIVMDEPLLRGAFDPESKVDAYIAASDAFVALCTPDARVPGGTAENIIDEIGRARTHPGLREVVCVLKDPSIGLPSNINPVWESLDPRRPDAAYRVIRRQLDAWGVVPTVPRVSGATTPLPPGFFEQLFEGIGIGDHDPAEARVRQIFNSTSKVDQLRVAQGIFDYAMAEPEDGEDIHVVTSFLEACSRIDSSVVTESMIEQLAMSPVTQHRMSAAMILWDRSETSPGTVPLDLIGKLARPALEDWYVFSPALGAAKQLALSRKSALQIILDLATGLDATDRDYAIRSLTDLARVDPAIVPVDPVRRLTRDPDESIAEAAARLLSILEAVTDEERRNRYGQFGL